MPDSNIEIVRSLITDFFNQHDPETATLSGLGGVV
jgi:hypothetical protein